jgi:transcriptional regulator with XRE-family HTH domain
MNEYQNKVISCIQQVKERIKAQSFNYQTIADRLNISLLTVKRQLNGEDISLSKLLALCDAAELNFSEIWQTVDETDVTHTIISDSQDCAFYKNPHLMSFFFELFQNKKTPEEIELQWDLTPASLHLYLRKLESLDLIHVSVQQRITFKIKEPIGFGPESKFIRKEFAEALSKVSKQLSSEKDAEAFLIVKPLKLSDDLRSKMHEELFSVISRYAELSEKYFIQSEYPVFNLVTCDYRVESYAEHAKIINVTGFD